jgi:hypothetical protein
LVLLRRLERTWRECDASVLVASKASSSTHVHYNGPVVTIGITNVREGIHQGCPCLHLLKLELTLEFWRAFINDQVEFQESGFNRLTSRDPSYDVDHIDSRFSRVEDPNSSFSWMNLDHV